MAKSNIEKICMHVNQYIYIWLVNVNWKNHDAPNDLFWEMDHNLFCWFQKILQLNDLWWVLSLLWDKSVLSVLWFPPKSIQWCSFYETPSLLSVLWFILSEYPPDECSMFGDVVFMRCHQYSQCFDLFFQNILQMSVLCLVMLCLWDVRTLELAIWLATAGIFVYSLSTL